MDIIFEQKEVIKYNNMDFGEDLNIGMLSNDDKSTQEDFLIDEKSGLGKDLDGTLPPEPIKKEIKDDLDLDHPLNIKKPSDGDSLQESVAGKEGKGAPDAKTSSPSADKLSAIYSSVATHLHETGVLPSLNIDDKAVQSAESLSTAIQAEINNGLDETVKQYKEAMQRGEPEDAYVKYTKQQEQLTGITEEMLDAQEGAELRYKINAQDFLNRGFDVEEAKKFAQRSADIGEDANDAKRALERIKEHNKKEYDTSVATKASKEEAATTSIKDFINNTDEIIKGIKLNALTKENLIKQMTTAVGRDDKGNPITAYGDALTKDPVQTKAVTEYLFLVTKGFTDFSKINNLIASKTTSKIDDVLRQTGSDFLGGKIAGDTQSNFSIDDEFTLDV